MYQRLLLQQGQEPVPLLELLPGQELPQEPQGPLLEPVPPELLLRLLLQLLLHKQYHLQ